MRTVLFVQVAASRAASSAVKRSPTGSTSSLHPGHRNDESLSLGHDRETHVRQSLGARETAFFERMMPGLRSGTVTFLS
jgi:hypothetical protein